MLTHHTVGSLLSKLTLVGEGGTGMKPNNVSRWLKELSTTAEIPSYQQVRKRVKCKSNEFPHWAGSATVYVRLFATFKFWDFCRRERN